jgi:hypothetical protein
MDNVIASISRRTREDSFFFSFFGFVHLVDDREDSRFTGSQLTTTVGNCSAVHPDPYLRKVSTIAVVMTARKYAEKYGDPIFSIDLSAGFYG